MLYAASLAKKEGSVRFDSTGFISDSQIKINQNHLLRQYKKLLGQMKKGEYDAVITGCREIIKRDFSFYKAYKLLTEAAAEKKKLYSLEKDLDETVAFLQGLTEGDPSNYYNYYGLGLCYKKRDNYLKAKECLEKSVELGANFWDVFEELISYYRYQRDLEKAEYFFSERIKSSPNAALLYQGLGYINFILSDYKKAIFDLKKAYEIQKRTHLRQTQERCLYLMSQVYIYLNNYPRALEVAQQGLRISKESGNRSEETDYLDLISYIYTDFGNNSKALKLCQQALAISRDIVDKKSESLCLRTLGIIYKERGDLFKALNCLNQSLRILREVGDLRNQAVCLYWITTVFIERGDYSKALEYSRRSLKINRQIGFKTGVAFSLDTISDIYLSLGNYEKALNFNKEALKISERYIGKWSREKCLNTIGFIYVKLRNYQKALDYFKWALEYLLQIGHKRNEAKSLYNIGYAYLQMDNYHKALEFFLKSLKHARQNEQKTIVALNYNSLGDLYFKKNDYQKSREFYAKALQAGKEAGCPNIIWEAYYGLGSVYNCQQKYIKALDCYKEAVKVIEDVRSQIISTEYKSGFFKSKIGIYEDVINLLYELHQLYPAKGFNEECFYYSEKAKARSFFEDLQRGRINFNILASSKESQDKIEIISRRISRILRDLTQLDLTDSKRTQLVSQLEEAEDEYQNIMDTIKREYPGSANVIFEEPFKLEEIQSKLLDKKTGIIEYFFGEDNLFVFSVTKASLKIYRLPPDISRSTRKLVNNCLRLLSSREISGFDGQVAFKKLYKRLIFPVREAISEEVENLIIVPDGNLYYLPFEILVEDRHQKEISPRIRYLLEDYRISYSPSASSLINILNRESQKQKKDLLAVGDPLLRLGKEQEAESFDANKIIREYYLEKRFNIYPLTFASKEIKSISKLIKKGFKLTLFREKATEDNIKNMPLDEYKIIHFATHSLLDENNASRSALVLSLDENPEEDGFFQAREIYNTKLNADLVVLSACQTAKGKMEKGEGIRGLVRAFFCAGTKSILASLWNINDKSTAEFMKLFYKFLADGKTKQEALRLTKIKMLHSKYENPYYWAAFILIGKANSNISLHKRSFLEKIFIF